MVLSIHENDREHYCIRLIEQLFLFVLLILLSSTFSREVVRAEGLTDLFDTLAFSGSWNVFSKLNFLGALLNGIISVFSFLGLFSVCLRIMITMLYLSGRNLFDTIDEIKGKGKGKKGFGLSGIASEIFSANYGTGLDAVFSFILSLFPNVKAYSDYADGKRAYNLSDDDTVTTYILKISLPSILTIFFFSIGFNGVLWQSFGTVVDAMGVAASRFATTELDTYVNRALNTGSSYKFGFSGDGSEYGNFQQKLAKTVYNKILSKSKNLDSNTQITVGSSVDSWITENFKKENVFSSIGYDKNGDDELAKNIEYSVVVNSTKSYDASSSTIYKNAKADKFGLDGDLYVHVFVSKKKNTDETNYFTKVEKNQSSSQSSDKPQQLNTDQAGDGL